MEGVERRWIQKCRSTISEDLNMDFFSETLCYFMILKIELTKRKLVSLSFLMLTDSFDHVDVYRAQALRESEFGSQEQ